MPEAVSAYMTYSDGNIMVKDTICTVIITTVEHIKQIASKVDTS